MTTHLKTIEQQYQVLTELEHVRMRVGMYAGSSSLETRDEFIFNLHNNTFENKSIEYIPALIKIVSEVLDNSVDEHKRNPDKLNKLIVTISDDEICIEDNGGIPVVIHKEFDKYVPEIIFGTLRSGSNYSDEEEQSLIGSNGYGSKLSNILSDYFIVETSDGINNFKQEFSNGMSEKSEPIITKSKKNYTKITFKPDLKYFNLNSFDDNHINKILRRLVDITACNPHLKVFFNNEQIKIKDFNQYINLYYPENCAFIEDENWNIGLASSSGYNQTSFVNSVETYMGGTHVDYVLNQIITKLREFFKKKHKIEVKPSDIKSHLHIFINCNINRPKFSSQTKENMISSVSDFGTSWECTDKFIKKVIELEAIQNILDWVKAKEQANLNAELRKLNKNISKNDPRKVEKFSDANEKVNRHLCELYLAEGDAARKSIQGARGKNPYIGSFSLRGKPLNVMDADVKTILANDEIKNLLTILGLELGKKVEDINQIRFGKIVTMTDEDLDGRHITSLLHNLFARFFPELFELGAIYRLKTPLYIVTLTNKTELEFFTDSDYHEWANKGIKHKFDYFKGLGTFEDYQFKKIIDNREKYLIQFSKLETIDVQRLELAFSDKEADSRKDWLSDSSYFHSYD